jgi:alpha-L-arabinofuranosidase
LKNAVEYYDTNFQQILTTLSPGWLRFPGGTDSEAFDWASGEIVSAWVDALATNSYQHDINAAAQPVVGGKGGASFSDFADMATNVGGAKIIVSVNAFTDTPQSAQAFARYALTNHISVAAWELANEPYTWIKSGAFFTDATDYANKMKPYRDAIKAADPNAVVALYFSEAGHPDIAWDNALASYSSKYWDAVTYHEYVYPGNLTTFDDLMAAANGNLFSNTTSHVTDYLMPRNNSGVTYLISEVSPSDGHGGVLLGTLYGGIYSAEFALRMSTLPQVKYVASFQMLSNAGIEETNNNLNVVDAAYNSGTTTNTSGLNFGFFLSAQAAGEAVANGALHNAIRVYATTTTGGPTAPTNGGGSIPAVYAQAYEGGNGKRYVVLTNKGASTAVVHIMRDGVVRANPMQMTFVTGTNPSLINTNPGPNNVQIQTQTVTTPQTVTIPPYSVARLEW